MFQSIFSRELVGGNSYDTQKATSMYLLFTIPHISLTQQTCHLELQCSGTWAIIVSMGVWMSSQRYPVLLLNCKAFFQCMHVRLFVYIELTSLATIENTMLTLKGFFCTLKQKYHNLTKHNHYNNFMYSICVPCSWLSMGIMNKFCIQPLSHAQYIQTLSSSPLA